MKQDREKRISNSDLLGTIKEYLNGKAKDINNVCIYFIWKEMNKATSIYKIFILYIYKIYAINISNETLPQYRANTSQIIMQLTFVVRLNSIWVIILWKQ